jgi:hypothetical protein
MHVNICTILPDDFSPVILISEVLPYDYSLLLKPWETLAFRYSVTLGTLPRLKKKLLKAYVTQAFYEEHFISLKRQEKLARFSLSTPWMFC